MSAPGTSSPPNPNPPKKKTRESEIALLEQISTSLDTYIDDNPRPVTLPPPVPSQAGSTTPTASDASKHAAKNFLAAKTLAKSLGKACVGEGAAKDAATMEIETEGEWPTLLGVLVSNYEGKYPSLTKRMLVDGITRYSAQHGDGPASKEGAAQESSAAQTLARIIAVVDEDMAAYHAKIDALRRSREAAAAAAAAPAPAAPKAEAGKKRKRKSRAKGATDDPPKPKKPKVPPKPRAARPPKDPQVALYVNEIVKKYAVARASYGRLPNGVFETLAEEVKKEQGLEATACDAIPLLKLEQKVRFKYLHGIRKAGEDVPVHKNHAIFEEVYRRYARTKEANGGKLPPGRMDQIVEGVKLEFGMEDVQCPESLKTRCQARFTKLHPEYDSNGPGVVKIGGLGAEDKRRRQLLLNEVTARYVQEKEAHPRKLADGALDRIIDATKADLGITEFEVKKETIRGRLHRNSFYVRTLGINSPYDKIDDQLVETLNGWLGQGLSVTRAQGLDLANRLLKERRRLRKAGGGEEGKAGDGKEGKAGDGEKGGGEEGKGGGGEEGKVGGGEEGKVGGGEEGKVDGGEEVKVGGEEVKVGGEEVKMGGEEGMVVGVGEGTEVGQEEGPHDDEADVMLNAPWWRNFLERNKRKLVCADDTEE